MRCSIEQGERARFLTDRNRCAQDFSFHQVGRCFPFASWEAIIPPINLNSGISLATKSTKYAKTEDWEYMGFQLIYPLAISENSFLIDRPWLHQRPLGFRRWRGSAGRDGPSGRPRMSCRRAQRSRPLPVKSTAIVQMQRDVGISTAFLG